MCELSNKQCVQYIACLLTLADHVVLFNSTGHSRIARGVNLGLMSSCHRGDQARMKYTSEMTHNTVKFMGRRINSPQNMIAKQFPSNSKTEYLPIPPWLPGYHGYLVTRLPWLPVLIPGGNLHVFI